MDESQVQEKNEGEEKKETTQETPSTSQTEDRVKKINEAADRMEAAEKSMAERERSLKEAEALSRLGGKTDAGNAKLTPEEEEKDKAQKEADEITNAFK